MHGGLTAASALAVRPSARLVSRKLLRFLVPDVRDDVLLGHSLDASRRNLDSFAVIAPDHDPMEDVVLEITEQLLRRADAASVGRHHRGVLRHRLPRDLGLVLEHPSPTTLRRTVQDCEMTN